MSGEAGRRSVCSLHVEQDLLLAQSRGLVPQSVGGLITPDPAVGSDPLQGDRSPPPPPGDLHQPLSYGGSTSRPLGRRALPQRGHGRQGIGAYDPYDDRVRVTLILKDVLQGVGADRRGEV